jgi:putative transposase
MQEGTMSRRSRALTESGIYHIMLRGNERKNVFQDEEDKMRIFDAILSKRKEGSFEVYAFCIMDNHIHLLIKENCEPISKIIKRIGTSYAYYYNKKHQRVGHVFQDRFKSEGIKTDEQLLEVIRYIHNNPVKANIAKSASNYKWSSFRFYADSNAINNGHKEMKEFMDDTREILKMFSIDRERAVNLFIDFTNQRTEDCFVDVDVSDKEKDEKELIRQIEELIKSKNIDNNVLRENKVLLDIVIHELKFKMNISARKISKILGIDRNVVQRIRKK